MYIVLCFNHNHSCITWFYAWIIYLESQNIYLKLWWRTLNPVLPSRCLKSLITVVCGNCPTNLGVDLSLIFVPYVEFHNSNLNESDWVQKLTFVPITFVKE